MLNERRAAERDILKEFRRHGGKAFSPRVVSFAGLWPEDVALGFPGLRYRALDDA